MDENVAELNRLAIAAELLSPAATTTEPTTTTPSAASDFILHPSTRSTLLTTQRLLPESSAPPTALITVPSSHPADWLFRLDPPVEIAHKLEEALDLPKGSLESAVGTRKGGEGEPDETVKFCLVEEGLKGKIEKWIADGGLEGNEGVWIKLAKV